MANFSVRHLGVCAYTNSFTLWAYRDLNASLADILADGFFNPSDDMLTKGDLIFVSAADGAAHLWVRVNEGGRVVVDAVGRTA